MQIGVGLPSVIPGVQGKDVLAWARKADAGPFSSLAVIDRLVYPNYETLITLAAAAGTTQRIRLMPSVLLAPLRNALRTGRCEIRPQSYVERVVLDASGRSARGVRYQDAAGNAHEVTGRVVIVQEAPRTCGFAAELAAGARAAHGAGDPGQRRVPAAAGGAAHRRRGADAPRDDGAAHESEPGDQQHLRGTARPAGDPVRADAHRGARQPAEGGQRPVPPQRPHDGERLVHRPDGTDGHAAGPPSGSRLRGRGPAGRWRQPALRPRGGEPGGAVRRGPSRARADPGAADAPRRPGARVPAGGGHRRAAQELSAAGGGIPTPAGRAAAGGGRPRGLGVWRRARPAALDTRCAPARPCFRCRAAGAVSQRRRAGLPEPV